MREMIFQTFPSSEIIQVKSHQLHDFYISWTWLIKWQKTNPYTEKLGKLLLFLNYFQNYLKPKFIHKGMTISQQISIIFELQHLFPLTALCICFTQTADSLHSRIVLSNITFFSKGNNICTFQYGSH